MKVERSRYATGFWRIGAIALIPAFLAACTSSADPEFGAVLPGYAGTPVGMQADVAAVDQEAGDPVAVVGSDTMPLPDTVAYLPKTKTGETIAALQPAMGDTGEAATEAAAAQTAIPASQIVAPPPVAATAPAPSQPLNNPVYVTSAEPAPVATVSAKKRGFLSSLFGSNEATASPIVEPARPAKPLVQLASAEPAKPLMAKAFSATDSDEGGASTALPGVRQSALFEIKRKSGLDDDSDVDVHEGDDDGGSYQVASAAGLARLAPNGLLTQTDSVDISCLKPSLVRVLKTVERHYGRRAIITSGYRNPERNRRARGAKNSLHMYCAAADVQIQGVSKWELAKYVRSMPGRGGVGTYCHTESVHIDVGPERDWNWRCRRRKG